MLSKLRAWWPLCWKETAEKRARAAMDAAMAQGRDLYAQLADERKLLACERAARDRAEAALAERATRVSS